MAEILEKNGVKGTFFIITYRVRNLKYRFFTFLNRKSRIDYDGIFKRGHEIGSHTVNHCNMIHATLDSINMECKLSSEHIHELYGYYPTTLSHPTSHYNHEIDSVIHLHYLDSRYSTEKDSDSTIVFMHVRTAHNFWYYKASIDEFVKSDKKQYIYGGHELDGQGYEPINSGTLDSLLTYVTSKYAKEFWITTFGNLTMYKYLHDHVTVNNKPGETILQTDIVKTTIERYEQPDAIVTLCYPNANLDFSSDGLVNYWYENGNSYVSVDLRKSNKIRYQ